MLRALDSKRNQSCVPLFYEAVLILAGPRSVTIHKPHAVDDTNPASPNVYFTVIIPRFWSSADLGIILKALLNPYIGSTSFWSANNIDKPHTVDGRSPA